MNAQQKAKQRVMLRRELRRALQLKPEEYSMINNLSCGLMEHIINMIEGRDRGVNRPNKTRKNTV